MNRKDGFLLGGALVALTVGNAADASEQAVALALAWLVQHQNLDGSWSFDHRSGGNCQGRCSQPGSMASARNGATAMALLPH